ncbi:FHA domain-containing protein [Methylomonas rhizoryzae]|uniref:FHA domain-containing protein n=1 Tax=Methylomonas rhizoryzae TaxID=2608981 RepID=UPI00123262B6|nr:FHA domain-containing protein [Methylomonas rhizoryzae]
MRWLWVWCLGLLFSCVQAQENEAFHLVQAVAKFPVIDVWLHVPAQNAVVSEQFTASFGENSLQVISVETAASTGQGVGYIFLVDISKSIGSRQLVQIKRSLHQWFLDMGEDDRAAILTFGHRVNRSLEFTNDRSKLNNAVNLLATTDMETSLYEGLLQAIALGRQQQVGMPERRSIVVLSDGIDDSLNGATVDEVLQQNGESQIPIYAIGFASQPVSERGREGLKVLATLSRQSGGHFMQAGSAQLDTAYTTQHRHIEHAYRLRLECRSCIPDGQIQHLDVSWSDGERTLNQGLQIRLLPKPAAPGSEGESGAKPKSRSPMLFAIGLGVFLGGVVWLYRQRLAYPGYLPHDKDVAIEPRISPKAKPEAVLPEGVSILLTVVTGAEPGKVYRFQLQDSAVLGRGVGASDWLIDGDAEISARHASIQWAAGKLTLRDLNSTNGTSINGVPIRNEYPLRNGDLLLLGRTELRITCPILN